MARRGKKKGIAGLVVLIVFLLVIAGGLGYMIFTGNDFGLFARFRNSETNAAEESRQDSSADSSASEASQIVEALEESTASKSGSADSSEKTEESSGQASEGESSSQEGDSSREESSKQESQMESSQKEESSLSEKDDSSKPAKDDESSKTGEESSEASQNDSSQESSELEEVPYVVYTDIVQTLLLDLENGNVAALADYIGDDGVQLSPTGLMSSSDVTLSREEMANFMSMSTRNYGTNASSGQSLMLSPAEYYTSYISPVDLDFSAAETLYNDSSDLALVSGLNDAKTVSFYDAPSAVEWRKVILVFSTDGSPTGGDVLRAIIYQDMTTY